MRGASPELKLGSISSPSSVNVGSKYGDFQVLVVNDEQLALMLIRSVLKTTLGIPNVD